MAWFAWKRRQLERICFWYGVAGWQGLRVNPGRADVRMFFGLKVRHG